MTLLETVLGQFGIVIGAAITAFTIIKMNKDYQDRKRDETRVMAIEQRAGKTEVASLQETIANLLRERERIIKEFDVRFKEMGDDMDNMEKAIREGDKHALDECNRMRTHLDEFIRDTVKYFANK